MDKASVVRIIEIARRFEDAISQQGMDRVSMKADDVYFLLCQLMPDPRKIQWGPKNEAVTWGDPDVVFVGKEDDGPKS